VRIGLNITSIALRAIDVIFLYNNLMKLGKKILIVGVSAAGKSTFARKLSEKTGISVTFMDAVMWNPGWEYIGDEQTVQELKKITQQDEWIIEGYITKTARTFLFELADTIIYLDYSPFVASCRYLYRCCKNRKLPREELPGSPDRFKLKTLKLIYTKGEVVSLSRFLEESSVKDKVIRLNSPLKTKDFLSQI